MRGEAKYLEEMVRGLHTRVKERESFMHKIRVNRNGLSVYPFRVFSQYDWSQKSLLVPLNFQLYMTLHQQGMRVLFSFPL